MYLSWQKKRNIASLVCIESQVSCPRSGTVTRMFKHTFASKTHYLALVQFYDVRDYDRDIHLWYVTLSSRSNELEMFSVETLSCPLV